MKIKGFDYIPFLSTFNACIRLLDVLTTKVHDFAVRSLYNGEEPSKAARLGRAFVTAIPGLNLLTIPYDLFRSHQTQPKDHPPIELPERIEGKRAPSPFKRSKLFENGVYRPTKDDIIVYEYTAGYYIFGRVLKFSETHPLIVTIDFGEGRGWKEVSLPRPPEKPADCPIGPIYKLKTMSNNELAMKIAGY